MHSSPHPLLTDGFTVHRRQGSAKPTRIKVGPSLRNRGDRAYHHKKKVQINHNRFLGYTKDADGNLIIDPEQAEIVKRIYREYLEGSTETTEESSPLSGAASAGWNPPDLNASLGPSMS